MIKNLFLVCMVLLASCRDDDCCMILKTDMFVNVENEKKEDLLDPEQGSIDPDNIAILYLTDQGDKTKVNQPYLDNPNGYRLIEPDMDGSEPYKIQVFLNSAYLDADNISYTYIQWGPGDTDEIKARFTTENNDEIVNKIWVNGQAKWEIKDPRLLTIVK